MFALWPLGRLGFLGKREKLCKNDWEREIIFNFILKADIEEQYMHLDRTFNALSNGTNYKSQFHR